MIFRTNKYYLLILLAAFVVGGCGDFSGNYEEIESSASSESTTTTTDDTTTNTAGFTISSISGNTTESGGTATFTVKLNSQPTADVSVAVSSSDTSEGTVSPSSLTFTTSNYNSAQTVTVTGVNDSSFDGNISFSIVLAAASSSDSNYNGLNPSDVSVTNTDDDGIASTDRWSSSIKGGNIVLSNNNLDATSQNTTFDWDSVYGEKSYAIDDGGIYEWKIQVISVDDDSINSYEMIIGVGFITEDEDNSSYNTNLHLHSGNTGFGYIQQSGKKTSAGVGQSFSSAYGLNDNITVRLDLNNNRLSFGKNNGDISVSHSSLPSESGEKYRLAASIGDDGDKFRIISHTTN